MAAVRFRRPRGARASGGTGHHRQRRRADRDPPAGCAGSQRRLSRLHRVTHPHRQCAPGPGQRRNAAGRRPRPLQAGPGHRGGSCPGDAKPGTGQTGRRDRRRRRGRRLSWAHHRHGHLAAGQAAHRRNARHAAAARLGATGRTDHHRRAGTPPGRAGRLCRGTGRASQGACGRRGFPAQGLRIGCDLAHLRALVQHGGARHRSAGRHRQPERQPLRVQYLPGRHATFV
ncbi:hypothetical protein G6F65_019400 [Rhizopus arrhizus]|nr:hypothetical protein G6F65_019400 [Rhizopus arrhizus]